MNKKLVVFGGIFCLLVLIGVTVFMRSKKDDNNRKEPIFNDSEFSINLIKAVNEGKKENYLISPYSIEIALSMLRDGAKANTLKEIEEVIGNREINDEIVKDRIGVANAAFIKTKYKNYVLDSYYQKLKKDYKSEILYDEFKTPNIINNWVKDKTYGMIEKVLDKVDDSFILGLANALAIDVEWDASFDCNDTLKEKFTKIDGKIIDVEMMHKTYSNSEYKYLDNDKATGIIIPYRKYNKDTGEEDYENGTNLEFVGILPKDDIYSYINNFSKDELNNLFDSAKEASSEYEINVSLPRFKYDYEISNFKEVLMNLGIKDAFSAEKADFTGIVARSEEIENVYVGAAIHKTHIDLNEKGTKAAAVTFFGLYTSGIHMPVKTVKIAFNKPFIYMIRDAKSNEILFFGTVYEPNLWQGKTCSE